MRSPRPLASHLALCTAALVFLIAAATPPVSLPRSLAWLTPTNQRGSLARGKVCVVLFAPPDDIGVRALVTAQTIHERYETQGVTTVAVLLTNNRDLATQIIRTNKLTLPIHFDPKLAGAGLARQWGAGPKGTPLPAAFLLDPALHVVQSGTITEIVDKLPHQLELTPPHAVDEKTYSVAIDALSLAQDMLAMGKPRSAARYLAQLPPESRKDPTVASRLGALTTALDQSVPDLLAETELMARQNRQPEAILLLEQCAAALKGTPSETQVLDQLHSFTDDTEAMKDYERGKPLALSLDLLDSASDFESRGDIATAYRLCQQAIALYPNTPGAIDAKARIAEWESTPDEKRRLRDALYGEKANALLSQADSYRRSNLTDRARSFYDQILKDYPDTTAATKATQALEAMK